MTDDALSPLMAQPGAHVRAVSDALHGDLLEISMGPHHPSTHGVFRMTVTLDGADGSGRDQRTSRSPTFATYNRSPCRANPLRVSRTDWR